MVDYKSQPAWLEGQCIQEFDVAALNRLKTVDRGHGALEAAGTLVKEMWHMNTYLEYRHLSLATYAHMDSNVVAVNQYRCM